MWLKANKRVKYIWVPEIMIDVHKGLTKLNMFSVFGESLKSLCSKQSKLNFWNQLHQKITFLCRFLTQTATWQPNHTILTKSVSGKDMTNTFFLAQSLGESEYFFYLQWEFFQQERVLFGWLAGPPLKDYLDSCE